MGLSLWHLIVLLVIVLLVFGAGKLPNVMGDVAKGIKSFKKGMSDEDTDSQRTVTRQADTNKDNTQG
jgi:sec-independent protein translocase protein TatA